eukprot:scaffold284375_cov15-Tisochrysis_lutea.AAC.1
MDSIYVRKSRSIDGWICCQDALNLLWPGHTLTTGRECAAGGAEREGNMQGIRSAVALRVSRGACKELQKL